MKDVLENNPHSTEVVRDWFVDKMKESLNNQDLPENFKEFMRQQGLPNDRLLKLFEENPRILFDVFDENGVIVSTTHNNSLWSWDVMYTNTETPYGVKSVDSYSSRKEAEKAAISRAFQILNDKLNITFNEGQDSTTGS
jgi:hypothetical protein